MNITPDKKLALLVKDILLKTKRGESPMFLIEKAAHLLEKQKADPNVPEVGSDQKGSAFLSLLHQSVQPHSFAVREELKRLSKKMIDSGVDVHTPIKGENKDIFESVYSHPELNAYVPDLLQSKTFKSAKVSNIRDGISLMNSDFLWQEFAPKMR